MSPCDGETSNSCSSWRRTRSRLIVRIAIRMATLRTQASGRSYFEIRRQRKNNWVKASCAMSLACSRSWTTQYIDLTSDANSAWNMLSKLTSWPASFPVTESKDMMSNLPPAITSGEVKIAPSCLTPGWSVPEASLRAPPGACGPPRSRSGAQANQTSLCGNRMNSELTSAGRLRGGSGNGHHGPRTGDSFAPLWPRTEAAAGLAPRGWSAA